MSTADIDETHCQLECPKGASEAIARIVSNATCSNEYARECETEKVELGSEIHQTQELQILFSILDAFGPIS